MNTSLKIHFAEYDARVAKAIEKLRELGFSNLSYESTTTIDPNLKDLIEEKPYLKNIKIPVLNAAQKLKTGVYDIVIGGNISTTRDIILASSKIIGLIEGIQKITSLMLMKKGEEILGFGDCGVINNPSSEELADIAYLCGENFRKLTGKEARISLLSFSTKGSASTEEVRKIEEALTIAKRKYPSLNIDGPHQFDTAYNSRIGKIKDSSSKIAGRANVFIFPTLDAGNIGYKIAEQFGGYQAIGPLLLGSKKPFLDLSRGCSADDIVELAKYSTFLLNKAS